MGVLSASAPDAPYLARHVALKCGLPIPTPALIVNRLCGSGFQSIVNGVQEILAGDAQVVLTGGTDNMSACPYAVRDIRFGTRLGADPKLEDMMWTSLTDMLSGTPMGVTAENLAAKFDVTREDCDAFALRSQQTWGAAAEAGVFADEITPSPRRPWSNLQSCRQYSRREVLSLLVELQASVMVASEEAVKEHNLTPLARIVGYGVAGCEPTIMGIGPVPSIQAMLEKTGVSMGEVDQVEINEAFAAQALSCQKALDIPLEKFNTCGGAVALGHKLRRNGEKYGIGSACIGGGQGIAILFERV